MVNSCNVIGCTNSSRVKPDLYFHQFPLDNPSLLRVWLLNIQRENYIPKKSSRICSDHFLKESDYLSTSSHRLRPTAIPSQNLSYTIRICDNKIHRSALDADSVRNSSQIIDINLDDLNYELPPTKQESVNPIYFECNISEEVTVSTECSTKGTQTTPPKRTTEDSPIVTELKKKVKRLQQTVRRHETKIDALSEVLEKLQASKDSAPPSLPEILNGCFSDGLTELLKEEVSLRQKSLTGRTYSENMKKFALTINSYSAEAYNFLTEYFSLPCSRTMRKWKAT